MADDVFLKFEYDERDVLRAMVLRLAGKMRFAGAVLLPAMLVAIGAALAAPAWGLYAGCGVLAAALGTVAAVGAWLAPPAMFRADGRGSDDKRASPAEPEGFRDATMSIDASEDGVAVTVGRRLSTIRWQDCVRLQCDRRSYVLHFGAKGFVVVPRRAFRNEKRDAAFHELVVSSMESASDEQGEEDDDDDDAIDERGDEGDAEQEHEGDGASLPASSELPPSTEEATSAAKVARVGRNEPCPCGSGKKYKKCCLLTDAAG